MKGSIPQPTSPIGRARCACTRSSARLHGCARSPSRMGRVQRRCYSVPVRALLHPSRGISTPRSRCATAPSRTLPTGTCTSSCCSSRARHARVCGAWTRPGRRACAARRGRHSRSPRPCSASSSCGSTLMRARASCSTQRVRGGFRRRMVLRPHSTRWCGTRRAAVFCARRSGGTGFACSARASRGSSSSRRSLRSSQRPQAGLARSCVQGAPCARCTLASRSP
mmetsp:Transcript_63/g.169  ORF Transcript_63/g.169 Transcript_63/m.169 type:complete len:224 (-) Transcript_63:853-1524(-)